MPDKAWNESTEVPTHSNNIIVIYSAKIGDEWKYFRDTGKYFPKVAGYFVDTIYGKLNFYLEYVKATNKVMYYSSYRRKGTIEPDILFVICWTEYPELPKDITITDDSYYKSRKEQGYV